MQSLARPGSNTTGLAGSSDDTAPKQLELLVSALPALSRIGVLVNPDNPNSEPVLKNVQSAVRSIGLAATPIAARHAAEIEIAFTTLANERTQAVVVIPDAILFAERRYIAELALKHRFPSIFVQREYAEAGGLMSYGENLRDFLRRAASFVDKIFKGARPADLPVEQPTRFFLVINLKTAKALGLDIPPTLLARADG